MQRYRISVPALGIVAFEGTGRFYLHQLGSATAVEFPDPTPVALTIGMQKPETLQETIRRMVGEYIGANQPEAAEETDFDYNEWDDEEDISDFKSIYEIANDLVERKRYEAENPPPEEGSTGPAERPVDASEEAEQGPPTPA